MKHQKIMEDLYDLIKGCGISYKQQDSYAELARGFEEEARKNLKKLLKGKHIEWEGNTIKIGKHITLTISGGCKNV